ncbi:MAG: hypothetical protein E6I69_02530 [Chloroflexi bacterium]|nr:MAG: hypothetical protein E6I69_02530 [Chloroflexota bacterium]
MAGTRTAEPPELIVRDAGAWRRWLERNHAKVDGVRLVLSKAGATTPTRLTYAEALDEALAYGWIDGQGRSRDESSYMVRFTPRRKRSAWSKRNTVIAGRLIKEGRMHAAGLAEIERKAMFATLTRLNRYAILYRIQNAKRADTRARRIAQFVAMLARGETIYAQRQK